MGKSLYEISTELEDLFLTVEEQGGELTEEQEKQLEISQGELEDKLDNYCEYITVLESEVDCAKNEKKRLNDRQNAKKNMIEKLKESLLKAVNKFGSYGKSGNKVIEGHTHKLFTRNSQSLVVDEERFNKMANYVKDYLIELYKEGILVTGEDVDITGMLGAINHIAKSEMGEGFIPYTLKDLSMINFRFEYVISFDNIMKGRIDDIAKLCISPFAVLNYEPIQNLKDYVKIDMNEEERQISFATLENKQSLSIK